MSNVAGRLIAGLGMNMQRWRWFTIAGIKKQWMKSLAGCTVTPVRPGTREDDDNTSLIGQSSWWRTSFSASKAAMKPGFLWEMTWAPCHVLHPSICSFSSHHLQCSSYLKAISCTLPSVIFLLPSCSLNCQPGWGQYALFLNLKTKLSYLSCGFSHIAKAQILLLFLRRQLIKRKSNLQMLLNWEKIIEMFKVWNQIEILQLETWISL